MRQKFALAALTAAAVMSLNAAALAEANDYSFELISPEMKKGDDVTVAVRLVHKATGKPVPEAVIIRQRVDMAPDGMAEMESAVSFLPASEPGVYAFKTDLPMPGRYQLSLAAKVQGEAETVIGKLIITATK